MRIKTITCHDVYNYGASLQAYALMSYLSGEGHDVQIIDYKPDYLSHQYEFGYVSPRHRFYNKCNSSKLFWFLYGIRLLPVTYATWRRIHPFKEFKRYYLNCTRTYRSYKELVMDPPAADLYIAGSDQIWNCDMPNGRDPAFYLKFGNPQTKRISYAASFGMSEVPLEDFDVVKDNLKSLDFITCREKSGVAILNSMGYEGQVMPDPVFLLTRTQWMHFCGEERLVDKPYILVYSLNTNNMALEKTAVALAKEKKMMMVAVDNFSKVGYVDKNYTKAGPREFVNLIAHAKYVVTDSFHASSFATIMNVPFSVFYTGNASSRIQNMLSSVGLGSCLNPISAIETFDWQGINEQLMEYSSAGKVFLSSLS